MSVGRDLFKGTDAEDSPPRCFTWGLALAAVGSRGCVSPGAVEDQFLSTSFNPYPKNSHVLMFLSKSDNFLYLI